MGVIQVACSAFFMFSILNTVQSDSYKEIRIAEDGITEPGVFKYQNIYYMVGRKKLYFTLKSSKDLLTWKNESYPLMSDVDSPKWADRRYHNIFNPEIHVVQNKFNLYFQARNSETKKYCIAVATADTILGPYRDIGRPLLSIDESVGYPHITNEGRYVYLIFWLL